MELEGWRRVGEGRRIGAAENKTGGSGRHGRIRRTGGVEGEAASPRGWDGVGGTHILILRIRR